MEWLFQHVRTYVQTVILDRYIMYSTILDRYKSNSFGNVELLPLNEVEIVDREDYYIDFLN